MDGGVPADDEVSSPAANGGAPGGPGWPIAFTTTHWSVVLTAQDESPDITSYLLLACALVSLVAAMAVGTSAPAQASAEGQVCGIGMLKGLYLATWDGYANFGGNLVPKALMEGKRFNGDGTWVNEFGTVNVGGTTIIDDTAARAIKAPWLLGQDPASE